MDQMSYVVGSAVASDAVDKEVNDDAVVTSCKDWLRA